MHREVQKILSQIPCFHRTDIVFTWAIFASDLFKRRCFIGGYFLPKHNLGGMENKKQQQKKPFRDEERRGGANIPAFPF